MDYIKTSELTEKTTIATTDLFEIVDMTAGINKKVLLSTLQKYSRPYKVYSALLTQAGTGAPVATVLENTLGGTVVWTRGVAGGYIGTLAGAFTENKTVCPQNNTYFSDAENAQCRMSLYRSENNVVLLDTYNGSGVRADELLTDIFIEIRVYD